MVKVKVISRDPQEYASDKLGNGIKTQHNTKPTLHPFQLEREYVRAVNGAKMEKILARPFVASLSGHIDGVNTLARHPTRASCLISGGSDGEIRIWDVAAKKTMWKARGFNRAVTGLVTDSSGQMLLSCGDNLIKIYGIDSNEFSTMGDQDEATTVLTGDHPFTSIDHKLNSSVFATSGSAVQLWDHNRSKPIRTFTWGSDTSMKVKFNQVEPDILASCMMDRGIFLADSRQNTALTKLYLKNKTNSIAWNPREAYIFSIANEDNNCYTYDMRNMSIYLLKHEDHFNSVIDLDYSPTGKEFVTASYDRHIRIFPIEFVEIAKSREVYHTARMNRIFSVLFSADSTLIFSGSDDTNIRLWKTERSKPMRPLHSGEKEKLDYTEKLKRKFGEFREIKRLTTHRQLSRDAYRNKKLRRVELLTERQHRDVQKRRLPKDEAKAKKALRSVMPHNPHLTKEH